MKKISEILNMEHEPVDIDQAIDSLFDDEDLKKFITENNLSSATVKAGLSILLDYKRTMVAINGGVRESSRYPGYKMVLYLKYGKIAYTYERTDGKPISENRTIKRFGYPDEYLNADFSDFSMVTEQRREAYQYAMLFIHNFGTQEATKGMYISGNFRTGKTYLASAIGNEISKKGYTVIEAYYPELSGILKASLSDDSFQSIVEEMKYCDLLILDDFAGESVNPFIRDEALGVVLQYRMIKNKPIIITSNVPRKSIVNYLRKDGSEVEQTKAMRISERITELTKEFFITQRYTDL